MASTENWLGWESGSEDGDGTGGGEGAAESHQLMGGKVGIHPDVAAVLSGGGRAADDVEASMLALQARVSVEGWRQKTKQVRWHHGIGRMGPGCAVAPSGEAAGGHTLAPLPDGPAPAPAPTGSTLHSLDPLVVVGGGGRC